MRLVMGDGKRRTARMNCLHSFGKKNERRGSPLVCVCVYLHLRVRLSFSLLLPFNFPQEECGSAQLANHTPNITLQRKTTIITIERHLSLLLSPIAAGGIGLAFVGAICQVLVGEVDERAIAFVRGET